MEVSPNLMHYLAKVRACFPRTTRPFSCAVRECSCQQTSSMVTCRSANMSFLWTSAQAFILSNRLDNQGQRLCLNMFKLENITGSFNYLNRKGQPQWGKEGWREITCGSPLSLELRAEWLEEPRRWLGVQNWFLFAFAKRGRV